MNDPIVTITPAPDRPEPPAVPDLWTCRWLSYDEDRYARPPVWSWRPHLSMFAHATEASAIKEAAELAAKGCAKVCVVKIGSEPA